MICKTCNNKGVYNQVLNKSFYYCRNCKEEIQLEYEKAQVYKYRIGDKINFIKDGINHDFSKGTTGIINDVLTGDYYEVIYYVTPFLPQVSLVHSDSFELVR